MTRAEDVMPRWADEGDDWERDEDDWGVADDEDGDDADDSDDDDTETVPCPYCRREIAEDAERCPYCENYISAEDAPPARRPWWFIAGTVMCLVVIYFWIVGG
jgi:hypothetical protein